MYSSGKSVQTFLLLPSATKVQFSSVAQLCPTLCDPMNRSTPGLPVHHQLLEFTQTHVHRVGDAISPSHPLSSPSPLAPISSGFCTEASPPPGPSGFQPSHLDPRVSLAPPHSCLSESPRSEAWTTRKDALCADSRSSPDAVRRHRRAAERSGPPGASRDAALCFLGRGERAGTRPLAARPRAARTRGAHPWAAGRAGTASGRVWGRLQGS